MPTTILDGETYEQARHRRFTDEAKVIEKIQQDEIIRMAREAGFAIQELGDKTCHVVVYNFQDSETDVTKELECFADLVAAKLFTYEQVKAHIQAAVLSEREACAKVCENLYKHLNYDVDCQKLWPHTKMINDQYAAAIRARGEE